MNKSFLQNLHTHVGQGGQKILFDHTITSNEHVFRKKIRTHAHIEQFYRTISYITHYLLRQYIRQKWQNTNTWIDCHIYLKNLSFFFLFLHCIGQQSICTSSHTQWNIVKPPRVTRDAAFNSSSQSRALLDFTGRKNAIPSFTKKCFQRCAIRFYFLIVLFRFLSY